ncbi:hypothetical protein P168DRAFT_303730 [Aspergillus campestris IBT 28561]|uniref:Uncharacterized protein n=1 Tax=Aspergillus campestris (strain IBT 28561) TaxID=1392248 RepID=A0A2I1D853_ASPC2|nr:uncharacterized protein P168DRAFT_303730 [Aspergillus campestris IBT 28561]PKY06054.1 hypothetical protein P168DRAFT_303730 [Aspergillus campestris IBT 28561]
MIRRFAHRDRTPNQNDEPATSADDTDVSPDNNQYYPSLEDVLKTRYLLSWKIVPEGLPSEIVDMIVDAAEYWPSTVTRLQKKMVVHQDRDAVVVVTQPLCYDETTQENTTPKPRPHRTIHPCRKIVFTIDSRDQGWGGGRRTTPYEGSFTWFDVDVMHSAQQRAPDAPGPEFHPPQGGFENDAPLLLPNAHKLQCNKTAVGETQRHVVTWHYQDCIEEDSAEAEEIANETGRGRATLDGKQVREMEVGDALVIWARARFGGWSNRVYGFWVRTFWAV